MKVRSHVTYLIAGALSFLAVGTATAAPPPAARADANMAQITVLYDAFGKTSTMKKDWGFSAFIEYGGKRILLDTGNNAEILAHNAKARGIDLTKLDFVVVTHRHGDHTSGLNYLMSVNPKVKIYAPKENFGVFGAALLFGVADALQLRAQILDIQLPFQFMLMLPYLLTIIVLAVFVRRTHDPAALGKHYQRGRKDS